MIILQHFQLTIKLLVYYLPLVAVVVSANFTSSNVHMSYFPEKKLKNMIKEGYFITSVLRGIMIFIKLDGSIKQYCDITTLLGYYSALSASDKIKWRDSPLW